MDQSPTSRRHPQRRVTVSEAAGVLGISVEAVRGRVKRDTIPHERDGGAVYVLMDTDQAQPGATSQRPADDRPNDQSELVEVLREQVEDLRIRLDREQEANRENRRLLAAALERVPPQLEAAEPTVVDQEGEEPPESTEGSRRPWWRFWR